MVKIWWKLTKVDTVSPIWTNFTQTCSLTQELSWYADFHKKTRSQPDPKWLPMGRKLAFLRAHFLYVSACNLDIVSLIWTNLHTNMRPNTRTKLICRFCRFSQKQDVRQIENGCRWTEMGIFWDILACNSDTVSLIWTKLHTNMWHNTSTSFSHL